MFVNQFAISLFGSMLAMATVSSKNNALTVVVSICAIIFYLFLLYIMTWEIGAKDRISVDTGKKAYKPMTGLWLSLLANIPNFLVAIIFTIGYPSMLKGVEWGANICGVMQIFLFVIEGMYLGLLTVFRIPVAGTVRQLNQVWWSYYVIIIPALLICWLAYYLGHKNVRFTSLFVYKDPNQKKKK
jgi:hypothetical protein